MGNIINFIKELFFQTPFGELTIFQITIGILLAIGAIWLSIKILKYTWIGIKAIFKAIKNTFSAKEKCKKIQCIHCGRTLDKCICEKNRKKSCVSRLIIYNREHKTKK